MLWSRVKRGALSEPCTGTYIEHLEGHGGGVGYVIQPPSGVLNVLGLHLQLQEPELHPA